MMSVFYDRVQAVFLQLAETRKQEIRDKICVGNIQALEVYKFECGKLHGLDEANSLLNEAIRKVLGYDTEEER